MTSAALKRLARGVHERSPQMPGSAFCDTKDASPATLALGERDHALAATLYFQCQANKFYSEPNCAREERQTARP